MVLTKVTLYVLVHIRTKHIVLVLKSVYHFSIGASGGGSVPIGFINITERELSIG